MIAGIKVKVLVINFTKITFLPEIPLSREAIKDVTTAPTLTPKIKYNTA